MPRPPRSPPFPYTTLFRSHRRRFRIPLRQPASNLFGGPALREQGEDRRAQAGVDGQLPRLPRAVDRKSTRLNSSHANISYAVFCLKKRKQALSAVVTRRTK